MYGHFSACCTQSLILLPGLPAQDKFASLKKSCRIRRNVAALIPAFFANAQIEYAG